jgi:hypothetical protein
MERTKTELLEEQRSNDGVQMEAMLQTKDNEIMELKREKVPILLLLINCGLDCILALSLLLKISWRPNAINWRQRRRN